MRLDLKEVNRRAVLEMLGAVGATFVVGCGGSDTAGSGGSSSTSSTTGGGGGSATSATSTSATTGTGTATCDVIPDETEGPYPDKTGMLTDPTYFRKDVTEGKTGLPLALTLTVVDTNKSCAAIADAIVEIWHCDKDGVYSEYNGQPGVATDQTGTTFLRGLQTTDGSGGVEFTTIYPGWYMGRATHIHIDIYLNGSAKPSKTTQLAFPESINTDVYNSALYTKGQNTTKNSGDMVFGDGDTYELATVTGDTTKGFTASLVIGIAL